MANRRRINTTRAGRDGHEYHEAWVARRCLGLLLPKDDFCGVAIEGFSRDDRTARVAEEIADAVMYFGRYPSFQGCRRAVTVQVKYSIVAADQPFRAADAKKTIDKFAKTYRSFKRKYGAERTRARLRFELVTNRPILPELEEGLEGLRNGAVLRGAAKAQADQLRAACRFRANELMEFAQRLEFTGALGTLQENKQRLAVTMADWSPARDARSLNRLNALRDMVRDKAGMKGEHRNVISLADVLSALELSHEDDLLPCPASFPEVGPVVDRTQLDAAVACVPGLTQPLLVHADGGIGKTVFMCSIARQLQAEHEVVLFDCFGMGQYRAPSDARHLPRRGLVHIANMLACRSLCDPVLPGVYESDELIRTVRNRLAQAAQTVRRTGANRLLVLMLDAIDNAGEWANARSEPAFPRLLLQDLAITGPIDGVKVIVSSQSHRVSVATGGAACQALPLQPFALAETRAYLTSRMAGLSEAQVQVAQSRSRGNARILEHLAKEGAGMLAPSESQKVIKLNELLRKRIDEALSEARRLGYEDAQIEAFLAGLAALPPPVPVNEFAEANGLPIGAVNSFAAGLAPLLEQTKHGVMFRDEPTETLIRESYAARPETLRQLAANLLAMQGRSIYAATTLPDLLRRLEDGDRLFDLAFDTRIPASISSAAGQQGIRQARLRAAVSYFTEQSDHDKLVPLLVELSTLAAIDARGTQYLLDNPDLTVLSPDADALRRLFEARTEWPGTRHARLAIAHALSGDLPDAIRHAQRVDEWRWHYHKQDQPLIEIRKGPTALDMASIPLCHLARGNGEAAAVDFRWWYDWYAYDVATHLFSLVRAGETNDIVPAAALQAMFVAKGATVGLLTAAVAHADGQPKTQRQLLASLAQRCDSKIITGGERHHRPHERPIIGGMLRAAATALVLGRRADAAKIAAAIPLDVPTLHTFSDDYWYEDVYPYLAQQAMLAVAKNRPLAEQDLLPRELAEVASVLPKRRSRANFVQALKLALEAKFRESASAADGTSRLSYDTKTSGERFLDRRLANLLRIGNAFAHAVSRPRGRARAHLVPLLDVWCELRGTDDYDAGGSVAQRQHDAVGERLLWLAVAADPACYFDEVGRFVDIVSSSGSAPPRTLIALASVLARRPATHTLAGRVAVRAMGGIEGDDAVDQRSSQFAALARAMLPVGGTESLAYFRKGLEQMDAIGSHDWKFVNELMLFASASRGAELADADSHALATICELNLGEAHKFNWAGYGAAHAQVSGIKGIARLARWEDRDRVSLSYTLLPYLKALLEKGKLDPALALTMLRVADPAELYICGTEHFVDALLSRPRSDLPALARELIAQYKANTPSSFGTNALQALARLAEAAWGAGCADALEFRAIAARTEQTTHSYNELNNWRSPIAHPDQPDHWAQEAAAEAQLQAQAAATDPLDEFAVAKAVEAVSGLVRWRRSERDLLEQLRGKVTLATVTRYIDVVARQEHVDFYGKLHEFEECKAKWGDASSGLGPALIDAAQCLLQKNAADFVSHGHVSDWQLKELCKVTGIDRHAATVGLLKALSRPDADVPPAAWLGFAANFNAAAQPGVGQVALSRLLRGGAAKLGQLVPDGAWREGLYPPADEVEVTAGLIWFCLGSSRADRRWMAAHSLRTAVRLGRSDVLDAVVRRFESATAGAFGASELPFFFLHARLWLLIALARIALDAPVVVARHQALLEAVALDSAHPHALYQHFAREALQACQLARAIKLSRATAKSLAGVNRSPFAPTRTREYARDEFYSSRPEHLPAPEPELHLDYDFQKSDVSRLAALFGVSLWQVKDAITAWVRTHDATLTRMSSAAGRLERQSRRMRASAQHGYGEQLCWHGLFAVAGQLLMAQPVVVRPYDGADPWQYWLRREVLTRDDGLWLADGMDWRALDTRVTLREVVDDIVGLTADPNRLRALAGVGEGPMEWLVVDANWQSIDGVEVSVRSALVPTTQSLQVAEELAGRDPFHAYLPSMEEHLEHDEHVRRKAAPVVPWIVDPHAEAGLDEDDALGEIQAAQRMRLARPALGAVALERVDPFGRQWLDAAGSAVLRVETWQQRGDREEGPRAGERGLCHLSLLGPVLATQHVDLLQLVILRLAKSGHGGADARYWHSTGVLRITASGTWTWHAGRANEMQTQVF